MAKKINYKKSLLEIENIINEIENDTIDIDKLSLKIKKAADLINNCKKQLQQTEEEVTEILLDKKNI